MQISFEKIAALLQSADDIVITSHVSPDGDALGSALALAHHLLGQGKKVQLLLDDDLPLNFSFLPGFELFERPEAGVIREADLLVVLDTNIDRTGQVAAAVQAVQLNIDHHISNDLSAQYLCLNPSRAATGELLFEYLMFVQAEITTDMAICLYTAIATDCGFFRYSNTTPFTMQAGAALLSHGVKPNLISEALEIKPLATVQGIAAAMNTLQLFCGGKAALVCVSKEILATALSTEGLVDFIRVIDGVDIAIVLKYVDDTTSRVSMRSKYTDVSRIAMDFGGGGHARAAGCTLHVGIDEAGESIIAAIKKAMEAVEHA